MEQGWVKFYREMFTNPVLTKDAEHWLVWSYLMFNATHTETKAMFGKEVITLKAGQLLVSHRDLAKRLNINRGKVDRIFKLFKSEALIVARTNMQQNLIKIGLWDTEQNENVARNVAGMWHECGTVKETENEKEKRSKREKDKEKEINKNERMEEIYNPSISPQGETGREDLPLTEKDLDKWLEEDDGIDDWDKFQIFYKNLNSGQMSVVGGQQDCYTGNNETNGFNNTNPIQQENKECINPHPPPPFSLAKQIMQNACMESTQGVVWNQSQTVCNQPTGCVSFAKGEINPVSNANISTLFDEFWQAYPKKVGKGYAFECFKKTKPTRKLVDIMLEAIKKQKKSDMWKRDKGQYIPNPSTWLNQKRWEDDLGGDTDENPWSSFKLGIEL